MTLAENFSQARMQKCVEVFRLILNNWITTNQFQCRLETDEELEGKSLEELGKVYFDIGVGDKLTTLPFLDTLVVVKMIVDHNQQKGQTPPKSGTSQTMQVKTAFTEDEAFDLLNDMITVVGVKIRNKPAG